METSPKRTTTRPRPRFRLSGCLHRILLMACGVLAVLLLWVNARLYAPPTVVGSPDETPPQAGAQLRWLEEQLKLGAGERMQQWFPEGYFFTHALYGLAWVELGLRDPGLREPALEHARAALEALESPRGKAPFPPHLPPDHGMFYSAWRNHLLSGILLLQPPAERNPEEWQRFEIRCEALAGVLAASQTPFLVSYVNQAWPCDTFPAIHSLVVHDHLAETSRYGDVVRTWVQQAKIGVDPGTGLVAHTANPQTGAPTSVARATSQVIILRFLADIDPAWARETYLRFRELFLVSRLGIHGFREFPPGNNSGGDVDSGPLVFGISGSATVVGMGVANLYGDHELAAVISTIGEAIGLPRGEEERRYLGGIMPVGDAFLVHATTARPWIQPIEAPAKPYLSPRGWRLGFHALSLGSLALAFCLACVPIWLGRRSANVLPK